MKIFELYLDESGEFADDSLSEGSSPSLVGGLLCEAGSAIPDLLQKKITRPIHATEEYDNSFLSLLQSLNEAGGIFVIFENSERIKIVNGDITYLNVLSEGLVKILLYLAEEYPEEEVNLRVLIARRVKVSAVSLNNSYTSFDTIPENDYLSRLEEKLFLAIGKKNLNNVQYSISFAGARNNKKLMAADIICNTYITRKAKRKFTLEEQSLIADLYSDALIYPVFENATIGYLQRLYIEGRYDEMIKQICALPAITGVAALRNKVVAQIAEMPPKNRDLILSGISLQIGQYNYARSFEAGVAFSINYKKYILDVLNKTAENGKIAHWREDLLDSLRYWIFDTDFYILTMYDHMGNTLKCDEYIHRCRENIGAVNSSWEHIDYYFRFRIRELNCLLGQYNFNEVINISDKLINILQEIKDLFSIIGEYDDVPAGQTSELLGKVLGIKLQAYINLLHTHPDYYDEAVSVSDAALKEFSTPADIRRQWQYRSQLMAIVGRIDEALKCLMQAFSITGTGEESLREFILTVCQSENNADAFAIMHYTNIIMEGIKVKSGISSVMMNTLMGNNDFLKIIEKETCSIHPWQVIFWNLGKYYRATGHKEKYEFFYRKALAIASADISKATMYSFAVSMSADHYLYALEKDRKNCSRAESEYKKLLSTFHQMNLPEHMKLHFISEKENGIYTRLTEIADGYLK